MKCAQCGFDNPFGMKFCGQCGAPITGAPDSDMDLVKSTLPKAMRNKIIGAKIEGERKNVTVLFADVSGYTALSEKLDPEDVRELINSLFRNLITIVYKYEGTIDKFIGDCIMALFGAPIAHEDDPERALHAALEMMGAMKKFNEERGTDLAIHMGINSGVVVAGGVGSDMRMDYTVIGDTVNLASRLMELAKDDEILISESVYKGAEYLFEVEALKPVMVKGKAERVKSFRVLGVKQTPQRKRGFSELYSPLVGRDDEFEVMKSVLDRVTQARAEVISLIGEAGIGKSRVIEELRQYAVERVEWLAGKCFSYGKTTPFLVFLEQLRVYLGISEFDSDAEARRKIEQKARVLFQDKINEYLAYLCLFLSIEVPEDLQEKVKHLDPESLKIEMAVSVKAFFREIARQKPLVLYFEDMHWIDQESLDLILFLLDALKNEPILFLFETRPELESGLYKIIKPIQGIFKNRYTEFRLQSLKTNDVNTLVQNLLKIPGFPEQILSLILEKSEGNPFYIEEIVRSFIDLGVLRRRAGAWHFVTDISSFEIPDTIEAVIRSRVDRLAPEPKEVLGNASVIGRSFPLPLIVSITPIRSIEKSIEVLDRAEFIMPISEIDCAFRHILIRDVVYNGLLIKKRKEIHKKIAECIEELFRKKIADYYEILAYHYYNAEIYEKSYEYYKKAGDEAKELYRNDVAIECYTKALEAYEKIATREEEEIAELLEKRGDVKLVKAEYDNAQKDYEQAFTYYTDIERKAGTKRKIGDVFRQKSEYDNAIAYYEKTIEMLQSKPESKVLLETLIYYAWLISEAKGDYKRAEKMAQDALIKIERIKEIKIHARGLAILGGILYHQCEYDKALKYCKTALAKYGQINDKRGIGVTSCNIGVIYFDKGEFNMALKYYKDALTIYEEIGDKRGISVVANNSGIMHQDQGELDRALEYYKKYLTISEEIGNKGGIAIASGNIGLIYLYKGEFNTAMDYCNTYLSISEEIGYKTGIGMACFGLGEIYIRIKIYDKARQYLERSEKILTEIGDKRHLSGAYSCLSELHMLQENYDDGQKFAEQALACAKETGVKGKEIIALRVMGMAQIKDNAQKALSYLKESVILAEKEKMNYELARSFYEIANMLITISKNKEAEQYINKAADYFEKSGAHAWCKKADYLREKLKIVN